MPLFIKSWKTTLAAVVVAASYVGPMTGVITPKQAETIRGAAVVFGLTTSKDGDK